MVSHDDLLIFIFVLVLAVNISSWTLGNSEFVNELIFISFVLFFKVFKPGALLLGIF